MSIDHLTEQAMLAADHAVLVARDAIGLRASLLSRLPDVGDDEWHSSMNATRYAIRDAVEQMYAQALQHRRQHSTGELS